MNIRVRGIDISNGNIEDILAVLDILVTDLSIVKDEIKELQNAENLNIDKIQKTKEEFENSSFSILRKNTELFNKSDNILQNMQKLSNILEKLENSLNKEKITFDKEIKQKFDNLQNSLKSSINSLNFQISTEKTKIEKEFKNFKETIENELNNTKKVILRENDKLDEIHKQYKKKLEKSLNSFKEKIDEYEDEIEKKTFFQRWGAVFVALGIGLIAGILIVFLKFKDDIIFSAKYSDTCYYDNNSTYQCYVLPKNKVAQSANSNNYLIEK